MKALFIIVSLVLLTPTIVAAQECEPNWECAVTDCSGGVQYRLCINTTECASSFSEAFACGGRPYHWEFPAGGIYKAPWECVQYARYCGGDGVLQCQDDRLVQIETCSVGCYLGFCVGEEQVIFDPSLIFYIILSITLTGFLAAILIFSYKDISTPR